MRIVIVDDMPSLIGVYKKFFEIAGLKVIATFSNLNDLVSFLAPNRSLEATRKAELDASITLVEYQRRGKNFEEDLGKLRESSPDLKIILTTEENPANLKIGEEMFDTAIQKPFTISKLLKAIHEVTSPIRVRGTKIFDDPKEIESLLREIFSDSKEKMCSIRSLSTIRHGMNIQYHTSTYLTATSKGLKVFIISEITRDNLFYCKQLMINRGVQLRHLDGVLSDTIIWDEKHSMEIVQSSISSGQVLYSNLDSIVRKNQYLFDHFWNSAMPAEQKIKQLEALSGEADLSVISGRDNTKQEIVKLIRNARTYVDACVVPEWLPNIVKTELLDTLVKAISRGIPG